MESKAYEYMDWPRIEAIVYGEEASPKDVMAPRLTTDGVLVRDFFRRQIRQRFWSDPVNMKWKKKMRRDILQQ